MFMVSVCGHAPPFGAQPHISMWLCPIIISDHTDLIAISLFRILIGHERGSIHRSMKAWGCFFVKSKTERAYMILYISHRSPSLILDLSDLENYL